MSLFSPAALLWLLPLAAIILGLYLLKMKRRDLRVPATFLWPQRVEEIRANSQFQKLRFSWLLVLQLLAALLVCTALARPQILQRGLTGRSTVIVIDSSLTMGSTDVTPSRLEVAKQKAREIVNAAVPGEKVAIIEAGSEPKIVSPLTYDPPMQIRAIDSIRQSDANPSVGEGLRIAAAIVGSDGSGRIVLLSDGAFGNITNFAPGKASLAFETIGRSDRNVAITALGVTDTTRGHAVYCAVKNLGSEATHAVINVLGDGLSVRSEAIDLPPHREWSTTFQAPAPASVFQAKVEADDFLAADNSMVVSAQKGSSLHVLLVSTEDPFTEEALALDPRVSLDRSNQVPQSELSSQTAHYDVVVFDGVPEVPVASPAVLVLGSATEDPHVHISGTEQHPRFESQKSDPLLNAVDLSQVGVEVGQKLTAIDADVIASSSSGPEVLTVRGAQRRVYLSFSPLKSDLPLQPAYPIFIANCLSFLSQSTDRGPIIVHPGQPFAVPATTGAQVTDGAGTTLNGVLRGGLATIHGLDRVGHYTLTVDRKKRDVYCTCDGHAVDIKPVSQLTAGNSQTRSFAAALSAVDIWRYAAIGLLSILAAEWLLFARRS